MANFAFEKDVFEEGASNGAGHATPQQWTEGQLVKEALAQESQYAGMIPMISPSLEQGLGTIMAEVYDFLQPLPEDKEARLRIIHSLERLVPGGLLLPFGSFAMDLYTPAADLDLSLHTEHGRLAELQGKELLKPEKLAVLKQLFTLLVVEARKKLPDGVQDVEFISRAKVPILTFTDTLSSVHCDISVDNRDGVFKSQVLRWIGELDPRFRVLVYLVKAWAKAGGINEPKLGTLNSMSLVLMVIFHLQTRGPPILPALKNIFADKDESGGERKSMEEKMDDCRGRVTRFVRFQIGRKNTETIPQLFLSFLIKFASVEELWSQGLCASTYEGCWIMRQFPTPKSNCKATYPMQIEDPADRHSNCARAVSSQNMAKIHKRMQDTIHHLTSEPNLARITLPVFGISERRLGIPPAVPPPLLPHASDKPSRRDTFSSLLERPVGGPRLIDGAKRQVDDRVSSRARSPVRISPTRERLRSPEPRRLGAELDELSRGGKTRVVSHWDEGDPRGAPSRGYDSVKDVPYRKRPLEEYTRMIREEEQRQMILEGEQWQKRRRLEEEDQRDLQPPGFAARYSPRREDPRYSEPVHARGRYREDDGEQGGRWHTSGYADEARSRALEPSLLQERRSRSYDNRPPAREHWSLEASGRRPERYRSPENGYPPRRGDEREDFRGGASGRRRQSPLPYGDGMRSAKEEQSDRWQETSSKGQASLSREVPRGGRFTSHPGREWGLEGPARFSAREVVNNRSQGRYDRKTDAYYKSRGRSRSRSPPLQRFSDRTGQAYQGILGQGPLERRGNGHKERSTGGASGRASF